MMKNGDREFEKLMYQVLDGEADQADQKRFNDVLSDSPLYKMTYDQEKRFHQLMIQHAPKQLAPLALREKVLCRFEEDAQKSVRVSLLQRLQGFIPSLRLPQIIPWCLSFVLLVMMFSFTYRPFPLFAESVSSHLQYLKGGYPLEIKSDDIQTVRQWLEGKIDFAAHLPDMQKHGLKLLGARICHLKDQKVGYVMFEKDGRMVSLFLVDTSKIRLPRSDKIMTADHTIYVKSKRGYQSALCLMPNKSPIGCLFVTDMPRSELLEIIS